MTRFYCVYKFGVPDRPPSSIPFSTTLLLFQCLVWYHFHNSMEMKKIILKLELFDDKSKQKAMKNVACLPGVSSVSMDMKDKKLTVIGDVDPVIIVVKLRKVCPTELLSVGPAK